MKITIVIFLFLIFSSITKAQNVFREGLIVYKCDSATNQKGNRLLSIYREIRLYKKNDLYRLETIKRNLNNKLDDEIEVQIINENGKYIFNDSDISLKQISLFVSVEEEKQLLSQRALTGQLYVYEVEKTISHKPILNFLVEEIILENMNTRQYIHVVLTKDIKTSFGLFYEQYRKLEGTPFQFYDHEGDTSFHYNVVSIKQMKLSNEMFYLKKNYKVLTLDQISK